MNTNGRPYQSLRPAPSRGARGRRPAKTHRPLTNAMGALDLTEESNGKSRPGAVRGGNLSDAENWSPDDLVLTTHVENIPLVLEFPRVGKNKDISREIGYIANKLTDPPLKAFSRILAAAKMRWILGNEKPESRLTFLFRTKDEKLFYRGLVSSMELPVASLQFGTLLSTLEFINHWTINYSNEHMTSQYGNWMKERFVATFNFDSDRLMTINVWSSPTPDPKKPLEHFVLTVEREKKQLQRVIVSQFDERCVLFLELAYPASIRKANVLSNRLNTTFDPKQRFETIYRGTSSQEHPEKGVLADNKFVRVELQNATEKELYVLLSRIYARTHVPIEFGQITSQDKLQGNVQDPFHYVDKPTEIIQQDLSGLHEKDIFNVVYMVEVLLSLGAMVKDQILCDPTVFLNFRRLIHIMAKESCQDCIKVLESLVRFLNTRKKHADIITILGTFRQSLREGNLSILPYDEKLTNLQFEKVGLIVLTPTRVLFRCPEIHLGNTVPRHIKDKTKMMRVLVREDDGSQLRAQNHGEIRFREILVHKMLHGITICGRVYKFFGSSGSQQREMGTYFMEEALIAPIFKALGQFENLDQQEGNNMYKRLAREGQLLTQSLRCDFWIKRSMWSTTPDFEYDDAKNSKGKKFCFSDGCGQISRQLNETIFARLKIASAPCAFQFRFLGFKGMLAVNPELKGHMLAFRLSQFKFASRVEGYIELVKAAMPQPTNLSKPLINILCQNSKSLNPATHKRITNRILNLYEEMFMSLAFSLVDEGKFRKVLKELPFLMDVDFLGTNKGFILHQEDFFVSLVKAYVKQKLEQQINKISFPMPPSLGRSMFGVCDETGRLKPGQVFVQWTDSIRDKFPRKDAPRTILEGKVTVTKNPCLASGDVRIYEAVNLEELADRYWDVIVFPNRGNRPEPDKMAGSDLDGDEYTVLCDDELLLDRNEDPFDFVDNDKFEKDEHWEKLPEENKKIEYLLNFLAKNKIGVFADAQMSISDIFGINSEGSKRLIRKCCKALDFAKSGIPPEDLTKNWVYCPLTRQEIPPESVYRRADFKRKEENGPTYASSRMNGVIHRSNRQLSSLTSAKDIETTVKMNPILVEEYESMKKKVKETEFAAMEQKVMKQLNVYNSRIKGIRESYGIKTEGELFSGSILQMQNKLNERDEDDGSNFTSSTVVRRLIDDLFQEQRKRFFEIQEGDDNYLKATVYRGKHDEWESLNVLKRRVETVTRDLKLKALLGYILAYEKAIETGDQLLSFAWTAWDVLAEIQDSFIGNKPDFEVSEDSFHESLNLKMVEYTGENLTDFHRFLDKNNNPDWINVFIAKLRNRKDVEVLMVLFVLLQWAKRCGLITPTFSESRFLFLLVTTASRDKLKDPSVETLFDAWSPSTVHSKIHAGELIAKLMKRLASRRTVEYGMKRRYSIENLAVQLDWQAVHDAARKSFYALCIHQRLDELVGSPNHMESLEREILVIELPQTANLDDVTQKLIEKTGVEEMKLRRNHHFNNCYVIVLYRGNCDAEEKLRRLVQMECNPFRQKQEKLFPEQVLKKIMA